MGLKPVEVTHGGGVFATAERRGIPWQQVLDFSASINPLGPSARVKEAIVSSLDRIVHYPSPDGSQLRRRLASEWCIEEDQILTGNGSMDLIRDFGTCFPDGHLAVPVFSEFHRLWPNASFCRMDDPGSWPKEGVLVITRPVNPTGSLIDAEIVIDYLARSQVTLLVDESFIEFSDTPSLIRCTTTPGLLVLRSMTKFHALPGLRAGALVGHPDTVKRLSRMRVPWSLNVLAEQAAIASLDDRPHGQATRAFVRSERAWLTTQIAALRDTRVWPSEANYLYIETPYASGLVEFAAQRDILIRDCRSWPGCDHSAIRIAVRPRWENERLLAVWTEFLCELS